MQPMQVQESPTWGRRALTCPVTQTWLLGGSSPPSGKVGWDVVSLDPGLGPLPALPFGLELGSTYPACPGTGKSGLAHAELPRAGAGELSWVTQAPASCLAPVPAYSETLGPLTSASPPLLKTLYLWPSGLLIQPPPDSGYSSCQGFP